MTLHGNALTSDEAAQLAAIRDRHEFDRGRVRAEFPQWKTIDTLLHWHDRLASMLAQREAEIDRMRASLKSADDAMREAGIRVGIDMGDDTAHWMANEIDRLRAELLNTTPTLKWLVQVLGPEDETESGLIRWSKHRFVFVGGQLRQEGTGFLYRTRADVLAALKESE